MANNMLQSLLFSGGGSSSGSGVLAVSISEQGVMDKTWQEIHDADFAAAKIYFSGEVTGASFMPLQVVHLLDVDDPYRVYVDESRYAATDSASGYPAIPQDEPT